MGEMRNIYRILIKNVKGRVHAGDLGIAGRMILKWILGETGCENVNFIQFSIVFSGGRF